MYSKAKIKRPEFGYTSLEVTVYRDQEADFFKAIGRSEPGAGPAVIAAEERIAFLQQRQRDLASSLQSSAGVEGATLLAYGDMRKGTNYMRGNDGGFALRSAPY